MATVEEDYYAVLEVSRSASNEEIKQAYKVMARRWHPDRHADRKAEAEERFKAVGRAFNVLSDPQKRSRYDRFGPDWESGVPSSAAAAASPSGAHSFYAFQAQPGVYVDPWGAGGSARPFFSSAFAFQDPVVKRGFRDGHAPGSASAGFDVPDILASLGLYGQHGPGCTCGSHTHQAHHAHHAYHHQQQHQQRHFQDFQQPGVRPAAYADPYSGTAAASAPKKAAAKPNKTAAKGSHKPAKNNSPRSEQKSDIKAPTPTRSAVPTAAAPSTPLEVVIELPPSATAAQVQSPARAQSPEQIAKPRLDAVDSPLPAAEALAEKKPKIAFDKKSPLTSPARSKSPTDSHNNTSVPDTFPRAPDPPSQSTPISATTNSLPLAAESASSSSTSSSSVLPSSKPAADLASPQQVPTLRPPSPPSFGVTSIAPQPSLSPSHSSSAPSSSSASSSPASSSSSSSTSASSSSSANSSGFFSSLFGGGGGTGGKKAASKAPDVRHTLECTLEELSVGITRQVSVTERLMSKRGPVSRQVEYPVKIPPGACEGMVIRIKNAGDQGPDQLRGDRLFVIQERKHALFERQGDDLLYKVEISLRHALTGCVISLVTITEKKMNIEIRDIIHPNFVHTIKGEGMPRATAPLQRGDLLVTFILRFPVSLTSDQRAHITAGLRGTC